MLYKAATNHSPAQSSSSCFTWMGVALTKDIGCGGNGIACLDKSDTICDGGVGEFGTASLPGRQINRKIGSYEAALPLLLLGGLGDQRGQ